VLVLRGCLPSYYLKQLAQESVAALRSGKQPRGSRAEESRIHFLPPRRILLASADHSGEFFALAARATASIVIAHTAAP
jgi:hypothetical protein